MANKNLSRVLKTFLSSLPKEKFSLARVSLLTLSCPRGDSGREGERGGRKEFWGREGAAAQSLVNFREIAYYLLGR
jgi:hypothetical protein